jgi:hypothetical protein
MVATVDWAWLGTTTGLFALGAIFLLMGYFGKKTFTPKIAKVSLYAGAALVIVAAAMYVGVPAMLGQTQEIVPSATYDVTASESEAELSVNNVEHTMTWALQYNDDSKAYVNSTGVGTFAFQIARSDVLLVDSIANVAIGSVPLVPITGAASQYLIDQNADLSFNVLMNHTSDGVSISAYENQNIRVDQGSSATEYVQITMNTAAGAGMTAGGDWSSTYINGFNLVVAGEVWHCTVITTIIT